MLNYLLLFLAIGGALFVLKGLLKKLKDEKIMIGTVGAGGYSDQSFDALSMLQFGIQAQVDPKVRKIKGPYLKWAILKMK